MNVSSLSFFFALGFVGRGGHGGARAGRQNRHRSSLNPTAPSSAPGPAERSRTTTLVMPGWVSTVWAQTPVGENPSAAATKRSAAVPSLTEMSTSVVKGSSSTLAKMCGTRHPTPAMTARISCGGAITLIVATTATAAGFSWTTPALTRNSSSVISLSVGCRLGYDPLALPPPPSGDVPSCTKSRQTSSTI
jgi:hypothetical protein